VRGFLALGDRLIVCEPQDTACSGRENDFTEGILRGFSPYDDYQFGQVIVLA
jgi:hypothetical protein